MRASMSYKKYAVKTFDDNTKLEYIEYFTTKTKAVQAVRRMKADGGKAVLYKFVEKFDKFVQWDTESPIPVSLGLKGNVVIGIDNKCYFVEKFDKFVLWDTESPIPVSLGLKGNVVIGIDNKCYVVEGA